MRVRTDVAALAKPFDYAVPDSWHDEIAVGTRVRVVLHGRRVGGWVVEDDVEPPAGIAVQPLKTWSGWGPPASVVELVEWAAWRWAGPVSFFLGAASPAQVVRRLPASAPGPSSSGQAPSASSSLIDLATGALAKTETSVLRIAPTTDLLDLVTAVLDDPSVSTREGGVLVLVPSLGWAERLTERLVRRGYGATTRWDEARAGWPVAVGTRVGAWAPLPSLAAVVVLDAHDEAYIEESSPTYSAVEVAVERARRQGVPCLLTSPCPPAVVRHGRETLTMSASEERAGWPAIECVDRRGADPRLGLFSEEFVRLARSVLDEEGTRRERGPLVCVFNRTGRARLLACVHCGELAQCAACGAAVHQVEGGLRCPRCHEERPMVCAACGRLRMKTLRVGVSRLREELSALLGVEAGEVTGAVADGDLPQSPVLIGTEAVLHRVRRAAAVAFLDIDLHLLAARFSATDETLALLVRASRLVGPRRAGPSSARVLVQTRVPDHLVLTSAARGDLSEVLDDDATMRQVAGLPPFAALAAVSGPLAPPYLVALRGAGSDRGISVTELPDGRHLVRAADHNALCDLLAEVPRPPGRGLRIAVDPQAI
ncbi:MAG TPA: hypothetical protein VHV57_01800 [Acidimicrobiales bacterium]|nr:hypothetical protein [Acidimicrobiales bacterium]